MRFRAQLGAEVFQAFGDRIRIQVGGTLVKQQVGESCEAGLAVVARAAGIEYDLHIDHGQFRRRHEIDTGAVRGFPVLDVEASTQGSPGERPQCQAEQYKEGAAAMDVINAHGGLPGWRRAVWFPLRWVAVPVPPP